MVYIRFQEKTEVEVRPVADLFEESAKKLIFVGDATQVTCP